MWSFIARNRSGVPLGELRNVHDRNVRIPWLAQPTVTGRIDCNHPLASLILAGDLTIISGYDLTVQAAPLFQGPIVGYQKTRNTQGGTIQFTAAGAGWLLSHRLIGESNAGATFGTTSIAPLDRGELIGRIVDALNTGDATNIFTQAGNTAIRRGTITTSSSTYISDWRYKNAWEAITDLSSTLDGPDIRVRPVEPFTDATGVVLGLMDVAPALGVLQPNAVFAFGTPPHNVAEWNDVGDSSTLANWAVNLPSGFPDNATAQPVTWNDATSIATRGLHEALVAADLVTDNLRQTLVQEHVRVRASPRRVISFTPTSEDQAAGISQRRGQRLFVDFNVGDVIPFRAVERFDVTDTTGTVIGQSEVATVDLLMRVFAAELAIDDQGTATPTVTLIADGT
jgi:hypothetical protein